MNKFVKCNAFYQFHVHWAFLLFSYLVWTNLLSAMRSISFMYTELFFYFLFRKNKFVKCKALYQFHVHWAFPLFFLFGLYKFIKCNALYQFHIHWAFLLLFYLTWTYLLSAMSSISFITLSFSFTFEFSINTFVKCNGLYKFLFTLSFSFTIPFSRNKFVKCNALYKFHYTELFLYFWI